MKISNYDPVAHRHFKVIQLQYTDIGHFETVRGGDIMAPLVGRHEPAGVAPEVLRLLVDWSDENDRALVLKHFPSAKGGSAKPE